MDAVWYIFFFFQAEDGIRDLTVTGVQTCALPIFGGFSFELGDAQFQRVILATQLLVIFPGTPQRKVVAPGVAEPAKSVGAHAFKGRDRVGSYGLDRKSTRLNSSHSQISYAVFCLKKKKKRQQRQQSQHNAHLN